MGVKPISFGPFIKGVDASTGVLTQPKGSVPRGSNLLLSKRGSLRTCDGSTIIDAYNGFPTVGRGRALAEFFFAPSGVAGYYLRIMAALDQHLGAPLNLAGTGVSGGSLVSGQAYYWVITALDGVGGETTVSNEFALTPSGGNLSVSLTWNKVPNAVAYNVYRGTTSGGEVLLSGVGLPATTNAYVDNGSATVGGGTLNVAVINWEGYPGHPATIYYIELDEPVAVVVGGKAVYTAGTNSALNGTYTIESQISPRVLYLTGPSLSAYVESDNGTLFVGGNTPPIVDTSQQTALYAMPPAAEGISYSDANIVALFPAAESSGTLQEGYSPSGGVAGNVCVVPQMVQFTNQAVLALGNGFAPQVYSDPNGTPTNPAKIVSISAISVDANGVVTVTTSSSHGINTTQGVGANVVIAGVSNTFYDTNGQGCSAFVTIAIPDSTHVKVYNPNAIGQGASSGGTLTVSTIPVISTFTPAYPVWTASVNYSVNSIIEPTTSNGYYYKAIQGGTSGTTEPTFPTRVGQQVVDGQIIWQNEGLLNTAAPPPPGCADMAVYAGSLWMFNTWVSNTATGLDGPCSLRMSDVNDLQAWNPINQAFLDKDDGTEGMALGSFTIAAQGIPPEGCLCAFKRRAVYQIVGVFGADNFAIQRVQSDMGILAPRTLQFVPGFGLARLTYIGIAVFDGVNDRIVSTQVAPYLIGSNDPDNADIVPMDPVWQTVCQSALTASPPMYCTAIPIAATPGASNGNLTRIMCFDLVLKAWGIVDLPFPISTMFGTVTFSTVSQTVLGSASDGTLQQWQANSTSWATAASGSLLSAQIAWLLRSPTNASKDAAERLYLRRVAIMGQQTTSAPSTMNVQARNGGVVFGNQNLNMPNSGDFQVQAAGGQIGRRFDAIISGVGLITIDSIEFHLEPRPSGVMAGAIA